MKWLIYLIALLALAACGGPSYDPAAYARSEAEIARYEAEAQAARLDAQRAAELAPLTTQLTAVAYGLATALAAGIVTWALWGLYQDARRRAAETRAVETLAAAGVLPTPDGRLPVPVALLPAASLAALGAAHARLQLAATEQPLGATLTFEADRPLLAGLLESAD